MREIKCSFCGNPIDVMGPGAALKVGLVECRHCGNKTFVPSAADAGGAPSQPSAPPGRGPFRLSSLVRQARQELREDAEPPPPTARTLAWILLATCLCVLVAAAMLAPRSQGVWTVLTLFVGALALSLPAAIGALFAAAAWFRFDFGPARTAILKFAAVHAVALTVALVGGLAGSYLVGAGLAAVAGLLLFTELFELRFPTSAVAFATILVLEGGLLVFVLVVVEMLLGPAA